MIHSISRGDLRSRMTYDRVTMLAGRMERHLRGNRIVGLMLPRESSHAFNWKEVKTSGSWSPFETVYRAGPVVLPFLGFDLEPERRIDAVRVLRILRAESLVIAAGCTALNNEYEAGSYVLVDDHVNCTGESPLRGPNDERLGPRYPDMSEPYDALWSFRLRSGAASMGLDLRSVVYGRIGGSTAGDDPSTWLQSGIDAGIDVVGEGLLDEVIAAVHCGLPVAAVGVVEKCWPVDENVLFSSIPAQSEVYGRLAEIINQCLLCRGGMDDG